MTYEPAGKKPIETWYQGCRFRSRLEARWAVFLTRLGLEWEYEPQGFHVGPNGDMWYLPDFHLPLLNLYLEVKPALADQVDPAGVKLWEHFAGAVATEWESGRTAMVCGTPPDPSQVDEFGPARPRDAHSKYDQTVVMLEDWHTAWCACPAGEHFDIQFQARGGRILCGCPRVQDDRLYFTGNNLVILEAYAAARSARFERGESPIGGRR